MAQYEVIRFLTEKYFEDARETYTAKEVAKAVGLTYDSANKKLNKLWIFGYVVRTKKPTRKGKVYLYNGGASYQLNKQCCNTMRLLFNIPVQKPMFSDISEQKNPYIPNKKNFEKKKGVNEEVISYG